MSKEELLQSIEPDMKLTWSFFKRIYGYEITNPGYAEEALSRLEKAGSGKAREYYREYVEQYKAEHDAMMRNVATWYREWSESKYETKRREVLHKWKQIFQTADKETLKSSLMKLSERGVNVESFVIEVQHVQ